MLRGRRKRGKRELRRPMHKTEGVKEWKQGSRDRKKLHSSPDWFDELPMHTVVMPEAMILPDFGQPASCYAILTHTQTQLPHDVRVTNSQTESLEKVSAICLSKVKQTKCSHTFISPTSELGSWLISPALYPPYLAVLTLHYQWTMDSKISQEWETW